MPPSRTPPLTPAADLLPSPWAPQLLHRVRRYLWLKTLGITAFTWVFFIAYFHLLRHPAAPVFEMPVTALDRAIGFQPAALVAYVSLWFYVGIPPGLMLRLRELIAYGAWAAALCATGLLFFYFWPTAVPPLAQELDLARHPGFAVLQGVDAAGNACPSMHVASAVFSAAWIMRLLQHVRAPAWLRWLNWFWLALIVYSTLAIKQHVLLDAVAGAALGAVFAWTSQRWCVPVAWLRRGGA